MKGFALLTLLLSTPALAVVDGSPDPLYGQGGYVRVDTTPLGSMDNRNVLASAPGPNGTIYVVSSLLVQPPMMGYTIEAAVTRLSYGGTPDPGFSGDGFARTTLSPSGTTFFVQDAFSNPDGSLVIGGIYHLGGSNTQQMMLCKFKTNGDLDATFGNAVPISGCQINQSSAMPDYAPGIDNRMMALARLPDGRFIGAWTDKVDSTNNSIKLARFTANGQAEVGGFGNPNTGIAAPLGTNTSLLVHDIAVRSDGAIFFAGSFLQSAPDNVDGVLVGLSAIGTLVGATSVNAGGQGPGPDVATSVAVLPNNDVVVAGYSDRNGIRSGLFMQFTGEILSTVSTGFTGITNTFQICGGGCVNQPVYDMALQPDGKVLLAGTFKTNGNSPDTDAYVLRLNADLSGPDSSFSASGVSYLNVDTANDTTSMLSARLFDAVARIHFVGGRPFVVGLHSISFDPNTPVPSFPFVMRLDNDLIFADSFEF